jgi:hypothetical protein
MSIPRSIRAITTTAALLLAAALSRHAHAADVGHGDTPEGLSARFKTEDQEAVGIATIVESGNAIIFTAGSGIGYVLVADRPPGTKVTRLRVTNRLQDFRLHDARQPGVLDLPPTSGDAAVLPSPSRPESRRRPSAP